MSGKTAPNRSPNKLENAGQWRSLIASIDTVLFDCDGVLWVGNADPVSQAAQTIDYLRTLGKKVCFVTNNSSKSRDEYLKKFQTLKISAHKDEIYTSGYVAAHFLNKMGYTGKVYLVCVTGTQYEIEAMGMKCIGVGPAPLEGKLEDWINEPLESDVGAVVVGYDNHISYMKIMRAASYLNDPACIFIATNEDSRLPTKGKVVIPGTGCIVAAVKVGAEREPIVVGKPNKPMFDCITESTQLDPSRTLMVGDRLNTDILFGRQFGMKTLLVLTGISKETDLHNAPPDLIPDFYTESVADMLLAK